MTDQDLITTLAVIAGEMVKNCSCGGSGIDPDFEALRDEVDTVLTGGESDCPTCTPIRELDLKLQIGEIKLPDISKCPHDISLTGCNIDECRDCFESQPICTDLTTAMHGTIPLIVHYLQVLGMWERFKCWHFNNCSVMVSHWMGDHMGKPNNFIAHDALCDILINGELRRDAIASWLETKEAG